MVARPVRGRRQVKNVGWTVDTRGEREARVYNGGVGQSPQRGSGKVRHQGLKRCDAENLSDFG